MNTIYQKSFLHFYEKKEKLTHKLRKALPNHFLLLEKLHFIFEKIKKVKYFLLNKIFKGKKQ